MSINKNWSDVRSFGALHLLTRASYVALIIIPILAALWPAVRGGFNSYNQAVTQSKQALEYAAGKIEEQVVMAKESIPLISNSLKELNDNLKDIIDNYSLKVIENKKLPWLFGVTYLASVFVLVAHFIYQRFAPTLIQQFTRSEYQDRELRRYIDAPSKDQVEAAEFHLGEYIIEEYSPDDNSKVFEGAGKHYDKLCDEMTKWVVPAYCLYILAMWCIASVLLKQVWLVGEAVFKG